MAFRIDVDVEFLKLSNSDSVSIHSEIEKKINLLNRQGFLIANCDSIKPKSDTIQVYIKKGQIFEWAKINWKPKTQKTFLQDKATDAPNAYVNIDRYNQYIYTILNTCSNKGFPFAKIRTDSFAIDGNKISLQLDLELNDYYRIDSIILKGKSAISKNFLLKYLNLKEGMPYNDDALYSIQKKLDQLNFLQQEFPYYTAFNQEMCKLILFPKKQRVSRFDAIIGFLPTTNNKTIITGDLSLKLVNEFKQAEAIDLSWRRLQDQTQDLLAGISIPYLLALPFGADYNIKLYRRDTSFNDVQQEIAINYKSNFNNTIRLFFKNQNTSNINAKNIFNASDVLQSADINALAYGLAWTFENTDFRFNPRSGWLINLKGSTGTRKIIKNKNLPENFYEGIKLNTNKIILESDISYFIPIKRTQCVKLQVKSATLQAPDLFLNESYRIGGLKSMRGINEESIFANSYAIGSLEYRYLFSKYSNFFGFADMAWYENKLKNSTASDRPYSFGAGLNIETKAGIFSLVYAVAKQFNNPLDFTTGKIHFGLTGVF